MIKFTYETPLISLTEIYNNNNNNIGESDAMHIGAISFNLTGKQLSLFEKDDGSEKKIKLVYSGFG